MSDERPITRRELLRGRFFGKEKTRDRDSQSCDASSSRRGPSPPGQDPSIPVMRYPRSVDDVECGTPAASRAPTRVRNASRQWRIPVLRPPGAVDETTFLSECTRCEKCIEICPYDAISNAPDRFREAAGSPMIDPDRSPCRMCDDLPCIDVCEPAVLTRAIPVAMGTARIVEQTCLAYQGPTCTVCFEQCPVDGAITLDSGRPRIVEDSCTGCGVCRFVCPAPENAILLMPYFVRPARPAKGSSE